MDGMFSRVAPLGHPSHHVPGSLQGFHRPPTPTTLADALRRHGDGTKQTK
jgi:hypothetical protein